MPTTASFVIQAALWQQGTTGALLPSVEAQATVQLHVNVPKFQLAGLIAAAGETVTMVKDLWVVRPTGSPYPAWEGCSVVAQSPPLPAKPRLYTYGHPHSLSHDTLVHGFPSPLLDLGTALGHPAHELCQDPSYQRDAAALEATMARAPKQCQQKHMVRNKRLSESLWSQPGPPHGGDSTNPIWSQMKKKSDFSTSLLFSS